MRAQNQRITTLYDVLYMAKALLTVRMDQDRLQALDRVADGLNRDRGRRRLRPSTQPVLGRFAAGEKAENRVKAARWLRRALLDLEDAHSYVAADNPAAWSNRSRIGMLQLFRHPNLGRAGRVPGTRELVIAGTPFLVVYRLEADRAVVLTVLHGARRWPR